MNSALVQKSSVAAAEIDEPKLADILQVNKRVPPRHFRRFQHDRVGSGSSERTTAMDRILCAIGRFQPGTFLWGGIHAETILSKAHSRRNISPGGGFARANPKRRCRNGPSSF